MSEFMKKHPFTTVGIIMTLISMTWIFGGMAINPSNTYAENIWILGNCFAFLQLLSFPFIVGIELNN